MATTRSMRKRKQNDGDAGPPSKKARKPWVKKTPTKNKRVRSKATTKRKTTKTKAKKTTRTRKKTTIKTKKTTSRTKKMTSKTTKKPVRRTIPKRRTSGRTSTKDKRTFLQYMSPMIKDISKFERPTVEPFAFKRDGKKAIRIGSWNIERLTDDKILNPGVLEIICMTIMENGLSIVAIQEIADPNALPMICNELNEPTLPGVVKWKGYRGDWKCSVSVPTGRMFMAKEHNGFLYDSKRNIRLIDDGILEKNWGRKSKKFVRLPYLGTFKIDNFDCIIISVHLKATGMRGEDVDRTKAEIMTVPLVMDAIHERFPGEKDIIVLGDFNMDPDAEDFKEFIEDNYTHLIKKGQFTNIHIRYLDGNKTYDHIWFSRQTMKSFTGHSGVIRKGLLHCLIPADEWRWGGLISDHCPVWAEVFTGTDLDQEDLSEGVDDFYLAKKSKK